MPLTKLLSLFLSFCLILEQPVFAQAIDLSHYFARNPTQTIPQSDKFRPLHLRYISYDNQANDFKILLDKGDAVGNGLKPFPTLEDATQELMKYFFIGLALPNEKFWVNLRPDSPDNILDPDLEKTDIGRIFLEADLQLKKDTSSMTSPQTKEGKAYWDKLYKKAGELFGTENITIPTITRPWIVPNEIIIREAPDNAYIYKATLKVMLEEDYLTSRGGSRTAPTYQQSDFSDPRLKELNEYSTQLIKEAIIPKLTYAVNTAKRYAPLRQVYYSLILAQWFKQKYGSSGSIRAPGARAPVNSYIDLIDSGNLSNLTSSQPYDKQSYFQQYQKSFAEGEYNLQEPVYMPLGQSVRRYMSGGIKGFMSAAPLIIPGGNESIALKNYLMPLAYSGDGTSSAINKEKLASSSIFKEFIAKKYLETWGKEIPEYIVTRINSGQMTIGDMISPILNFKYHQLRVAGNEYWELLKNGLIGHDYDIDKCTQKETSDMQVLDEGGWYYRLPKNRRQRGWSTTESKALEIISLNVVADVALIKALDRFVTSEIKGYYKVPDGQSNWLERHDSVTIYLYENMTPAMERRLVEIVGLFIRSRRDVLLGRKISDGIYVATKPTEEELISLIKQIEQIDPEVSKGITGYVKNVSTNNKYKFSLAQFTAIKSFVKELLAEVGENKTEDLKRNQAVEQKIVLGRISSHEVNEVMFDFRGDVQIKAGNFSYKIWIEGKDRDRKAWFQRYDYNGKSPLGEKREIFLNTIFQAGNNKNDGNNYIMPDASLSDKHFQIEISENGMRYGFHFKNLDPKNWSVVKGNIFPSTIKVRQSASSAVDMANFAEFPNYTRKIRTVVNDTVNKMIAEGSLIVHVSFDPDCSVGQELAMPYSDIDGLTVIHDIKDDGRLVLAKDMLYAALRNNLIGVNSAEVRWFSKDEIAALKGKKHMSFEEKTKWVRIKLSIRYFKPLYSISPEDPIFNSFSSESIPGKIEFPEKPKHSVRKKLFKEWEGLDAVMKDAIEQIHMRIGDSNANMENNIVKVNLTRSTLESLLEKQFVTLSENGDYTAEWLGTNGQFEAVIQNVSSALQQTGLDRATLSDKGGIAFNALPIQTESVASSALWALPGGRAFKGDLDEEWEKIQSVFNAGIRPSIQRLSEYTAAASASPLAEDKIDQVRVMLADILRRDEESQKLAPAEEFCKQLLRVLENGTLIPK